MSTTVESAPLDKGKDINTLRVSEPRGISCDRLNHPTSSIANELPYRVELTIILYFFCFLKDINWVSTPVQGRVHKVLRVVLPYRVEYYS